METGKARRRGRSKSPETKRKIEFAMDLLKNKPELIRPQLLSKVRAARIRQKYPFIHRSPESIKQSQANLLKRGAPPTGHVFLPYSVRDTSAPSCATKKEDKTYNYLANVDPRLVDFKIKNPATGKVDEVFTAAMIKRYRGKSSETEVAASGVAHEELPGASVLKRFREELGVSSETVTTDSSTPTTDFQVLQKTLTMPRNRASQNTSSNTADVGFTNEPTIVGIVPTSAARTTTEVEDQDETNDI